MSKYQITDAAVSRIRKRIKDVRVAKALAKNYHSLHPEEAREMLRAAIKPEDFRDPTETARKLVARWIREGVEAWLCSNYFESIDYERVEMRRAVRDGFRVLKDLRRLTGDLWTVSGMMTVAPVTSEENDDA